MGYLSGYLAFMAGIFFILYWQLQPATIVNAGQAAYVPPPQTRLIPLARKMDAPELAEVFPTHDALPRVAEVRASPRGRALEWFMGAPVWTLHPDGRVEVNDLRFRTLAVRRAPTFQVEFPPGSVEPAFR